MHVLSVAQTLLPEILERIALLALSPDYQREFYYRDCQQPNTQRLFHLARVCKDWWRTLYPLVYRTVVICVSKEDEPYCSRNFKTLQQAVAAGYEGHVRQVNICIRDIFLHHSLGVHSAESIIFLARCFELSSVRNLVFDINICPSTYLELAIRSATTAGVSNAAVCELLALIYIAHRAMPNVRHVNVSQKCAMPFVSNADIQTPCAFFEVQRVFGARMMHFSMKRYTMPAALLEPLQVSSLRSISVSDNFHLGNAITLIQRSSGTLERLELTTVSRADAFRLFVNTSNPDRPIVYPRLKYLSLTCYEAPVPMAHMPAICLFPALEVLRNLGSPPFDLAIVLIGARARLKILEMPVRAYAYKLTEVNAAVGGGGFPDLERITLDVGEEPHMLVSESPAWLSGLFSLSPNARIVSIRHRYELPLGDYCGTIRFPPNLQHLSIEEPLTVSQVMTVIGGCPQLRTAKFALADYPERKSKNAPTVAEIKKHREQHRSRSSSLKRLAVNGKSLKTEAGSSSLRFCSPTCCPASPVLP